jgi:asparagine synthase (glutamine-hydrolysing)
MPGIAGLISLKPGNQCQRVVEHMLAAMQHEPFYTSGSYRAPDLGVFAGWVALEGSFADCQPIVSERGDIVLLLAGECFRDTVGRTHVQDEPHRFAGDDASWLVRLYEEREESFFEQLNGLFSGLLIDRRQGQAMLFNDRFGTERVYYHEARDGFYFASEAKALLRVLPELRVFDQSGICEFLRYSCTLGEKTLFRGVRLLPAASVWAFRGGALERRQYFAPTTWESLPPLSPALFDTAFEETFTRILPRYIDPNAEIGISLTGGLDSRMIIARCPPGPSGLTSYTFAGVDGETLDAEIAMRVASACAIPHHLLRLGQDFFDEFAALSDKTVYVTDGCFGVCGAHEIYLNKLARKCAPIRLTGNFGGEILRGVTTFKPVSLSTDLVSPELRLQISGDQVRLNDDEIHPVTFAAFREVPWHLVGVTRAAQSQIITRTPYLDNDLVALAFRAPRWTKGSSAPALRLIRNAHTALGRIPTDQGLVLASRLSSRLKPMWYRACFKLDYLRSDGMPHWLSSLEASLARLHLPMWPPHRHRYLHYGRWFRSELAGYLRERLSAIKRSHSRLWNPSFLERLASNHIEGRKNFVQEINAVLTLDAIERLLFNQPLAKDSR